MDEGRLTNKISLFTFHKTVLDNFYFILSVEFYLVTGKFHFRMFVKLYGNHTLVLGYLNIIWIFFFWLLDSRVMA